ncbi:MAG: hypothetical protein ABMB14_27710 [Myxococcota bacterium]
MCIGCGVVLMLGAYWVWSRFLGMSEVAFLAFAVSPPGRSVGSEIRLAAFGREPSLAAIPQLALPLAALVWLWVVGGEAAANDDALACAPALRWMRALVWLVWALPAAPAAFRTRRLLVARGVAAALLASSGLLRDGAASVEFASFLLASAVAGEGWLSTVYRRAAVLRLDWDQGGVRLHTDHGWRRLGGLPTSSGIGADRLRIGPWTIPYADRTPAMPVTPIDDAALADRLPPLPMPIVEPTPLALHCRAYRFAALFGGLAPLAVVAITAWLPLVSGDRAEASARLLTQLPGLVVWIGAGVAYPGGSLEPSRRPTG